MKKRFNPPKEFYPLPEESARAIAAARVLAAAFPALEKARQEVDEKTSDTLFRALNITPVGPRACIGHTVGPLGILLNTRDQYEFATDENSGAIYVLRRPAYFQNGSYYLHAVAERNLTIIKQEIYY